MVIDIRHAVGALSFAAALTITPVQATAQDQTKEPCSSAEQDQFDFWVGEWDLTWGEKGVGTNRITRILNRCVIREEFDGSPMLRGLSVSTYDTNQKRWKQTWVDDDGSYLDFVGGMEGDRMILSRSIEREGKPVEQRMVFYNIARDSLDWNWERSLDSGKTWNVLWQIHYKRKSD